MIMKQHIYTEEALHRLVEVYYIIGLEMKQKNMLIF